MKTLLKYALAASTLSLLAACGGGGDSASATQSTSVEGHYTGTLRVNPSSSAADVEGIILENGQMWLLYGYGSSIYGMLQGNGSYSGNTLVVNEVRDIYYNGTVAQASLSATYTNNSNLNGNVSEAGSMYPLTLSRPLNDAYQYNTSPSLSSVVGNWTGSYLTGSSETILINANGTTQSIDDDGCVTNGTIVPRPSGKNVFDITFATVASVACGPSITATGIAFSFRRDDGRQQFNAMYVIDNTSYGDAFFATR